MPRPWFFAPLLLAAAGCGSPKEAVAPAAAALEVAAASDLQAALPVLAERFKAATGVEVTPVFGSSGQLAQQIEQGAPFDVFLSANKAFVERLAAKGAVKPDSVTPYAQGLLVLVVSKKAVCRWAASPTSKSPRLSTSPSQTRSSHRMGSPLRSSWRNQGSPR